MIRRILSVPLRKYREYRLEHMVMMYFVMRGEPAHTEEKRQQARELILAGPYNPFKSSRKD